MSADTDELLGRCTRVLVISTTGGLGGPVVSLLTMLKAVRGMQFVTAGPFSPAVRAELARTPAVRDVVDLVPVRRRTRSTLPRVMVQVLLLALRRRRSTDVIFANGLTEAAVAAPAAALCGVPLVVWVHNSELPTAARLMGFLLRSRLLDARWMAVSTVAADVSAPVRGRRPCPLVLNPLDPADVVGSSSRRSVQRPPSPVRIGYLGSARHYKGIDLLPAIIDATTARTDQPVEWYVFCGLDAVPELRAQLARRRSVVLVGHVFPQSQAYGDIDIVLCPSREESFGRVAAEGMLNALPIVASSIPAFRELLQATATDALFPVEDADAAAELIARLVEDPGLRQDVGTRNRRHSLRFLTEAVVPEFEARLAGHVRQETSSSEARGSRAGSEAG